MNFQELIPIDLLRWKDGKKNELFVMFQCYDAEETRQEDDGEEHYSYTYIYAEDGKIVLDDDTDSDALFERAVDFAFSQNLLNIYGASLCRVDEDTEDIFIDYEQLFDTENEYYVKTIDDDDDKTVVEDWDFPLQDDMDLFDWIRIKNLIMDN